MGTFYQQVLNLITTSPGNLAYHLVLAFSVAGALQASISQWREGEIVQVKRMAAGFAALLGVRMVFFLGAGLAWQGLTNPHTLLPLLDRATTVISLVIIVWLWAFPEPHRQADAIGGLFIILSITFLALSFTWWDDQKMGIAFNASPLDISWDAYALLILLLGGFVVVLRRSDSWGYGIAMLAVSFIGHLIHMIAPLPEGDFPGIIRLAQMATYPLLIALPQRVIVLEETATTQPEIQPRFQERRFHGVDIKTLSALLSLTEETSNQEVCKSFTQIISNVILADICMMVTLKESLGKIEVRCGYDLIRQEHFLGGTLDSSLAPELADALYTDRPLRISATSPSKDLTNVGQMLGIREPGHLLAVPIPVPEGNPITGLILLTPYSKRNWRIEDQVYLIKATELLAQILQRSRYENDKPAKLPPSQQHLEIAQVLLDETQRENENLRNQLAALQEKVSKKYEHEEKLSFIVAANEEAQNIIAQLETEMEELREIAIVSSSEQDTHDAESEKLKSEFRLTLEEVSRLNRELIHAKQKTIDLEEQPGQTKPLFEDQNHVVTSISKKLRQPTSSIIGYTELLLSESVGNLGALQRKFLERIQKSTERLEELIDKLTRISPTGADLSGQTLNTVDLSNVIDEAVAHLSSLMRKKNIDLRIDLPELQPQLKAGREATEQIMIHLLQNAGEVTPEKGEIFLHVRHPNEEKDKNYILIQIADQGGGIATKDLPHIFSRQYLQDNPEIQGIGDTRLGLSVAKTLVEAQGGQIWVDSELGIGSTYNVLIPVYMSEEAAKEDSTGLDVTKQ